MITENSTRKKAHGIRDLSLEPVTYLVPTIRSARGLSARGMHAPSHYRGSMMSHGVGPARNSQIASNWSEWLRFLNQGVMGVEGHA